jgi:hypothetical protein
MLLPEIAPKRVRAMSRQQGYNRLLIIHSPEELFIRAQRWLTNHRNEFLIHCGLVNYDRGEDVDKQTCNSQRFLHHIF